VKKARMDKLGTESGEYDDSWYSKGREDLKMGSVKQRQEGERVWKTKMEMSAVGSMDEVGMRE
jgi:hypothetical protein